MARWEEGGGWVQGLDAAVGGYGVATGGSAAREQVASTLTARCLSGGCEVFRGSPGKVYNSHHWLHPEMHTIVCTHCCQEIKK